MTNPEGLEAQSIPVGEGQGTLPEAAPLSVPTEREDGPSDQPFDWSEYEDDISDAISDSIDMDWSARDGAKAVIRCLAALSASGPSGGGGDPIRFGAGRLVVDTGCYQQQPAVFICPVDKPGEVGASARDLGHDRHSLQPGEIVLTFPTADQAKAVADALVGTPALSAPGSEAVK